jgi:hypothetical protein
MWMRLSFVVFLLGTGTAIGQQNLNLEMLKRDTQIFENIVAEVLKQNFTHPFAIQSGPLAAYLQGYGVSVSFHLRINRLKIRTPFGEVDDPTGGSSRSKSEQLQTVKDSMIRVLADYGNAIKQISGHDKISISAHVEDRYELDPARNQTVMVFTVTKDNIDLYNMKRIPFETFRERVMIAEY